MNRWFEILLEEKQRQPERKLRIEHDAPRTNSNPETVVLPPLPEVIVLPPPVTPIERKQDPQHGGRPSWMPVWSVGEEERQRALALAQSVGWPVNLEFKPSVTVCGGAEGWKIFVNAADDESLRLVEEVLRMMKNAEESRD